jgi:hypothetical protein
VAARLGWAGLKAEAKPEVSCPCDWALKFRLLRSERYYGDWPPFAEPFRSLLDDQADRPGCSPACIYR